MLKIIKLLDSESVRYTASGHFLCFSRYGGIQPRACAVMALASPVVMTLSDGKWTPPFFCPHCSNNNYIMNKKENKVEAALVFNYGENENAPIRVQVINGETWFVAKDVCRILGIINHKDAISKILDDDEKGVATIYPRSSNGVVQRRDVNVINESGLYSLVFQSRKPGAKKFRKWVTMEVLPSIRKTGSYSVKSSRKRLPMPKDRDEVLAAFYAELPKWVTIENEKEVAKFFGVSRHHVHEVLMGRRPGYVVLAALTEHGSANRKAGVRRADLRPVAMAAKTRQLALEFADETSEE